MGRGDGRGSGVWPKPPLALETASGCVCLAGHLNARYTRVRARPEPVGKRSVQVCHRSKSVIMYHKNRSKEQVTGWTLLTPHHPLVSVGGASLSSCTIRIPLRQRRCSSSHSRPSDRRILKSQPKPMSPKGSNAAGPSHHRHPGHERHPYHRRQIVVVPAHVTLVIAPPPSTRTEPSAAGDCGHTQIATQAHVAQGIKRRWAQSSPASWA